MYTNTKGVKYLQAALKILHISTENHTIQEANLVETIERSPISLWIFSGSNQSVTDSNAPQVPLELLENPHKKILCICYSMESVLVQLGYPIITRKTKRNELIQLNGLTVARNHYAYIPIAELDSKVHLISSYKGEAMTVEVKNALLVQWHPERTPDGILFLVQWLMAFRA